MFLEFKKNKPSRAEAFERAFHARQHPRYRGCVGHWMMVEGGGSAVYNLARPINGALNGPSWINGKYGQSLDFAPNDHVDLGLLPGFAQTLTSATFSSWIRTTSASLSALIGVVNNGNSTNFQININTNEDEDEASGHIGCYIRGAGGTGSDRRGATTSSTNFNDGIWHHIVVSVHAAAGEFGVWVDGIPYAITYSSSVGEGSENSFPNFGFAVPIGARNNRGTLDRYITAELSDFRWYNRILSSGEIPSLYTDPFLEFERRQVFFFVQAEQQTQEIGDTIGFTEGFTKSAQKILVENLGLTEDLSFSLARAIQETLSPTETLTKQTQRTIAENVGLTEEIVLQAVKAINENIELTEVLGFEAAKVAQETVGLTEDQTLQVQKAVAENLSLDESLSTAVFQLKSLSDTLAPTEEFLKTAEKTVAEEVSLFEDATKQAAKSILETVDLTENLATEVVKLLSLNDTVSLEEAIELTVGKSLGDAVALAEEVSKLAGKPLADTLGLEESLVASVVKFKEVADSVSLTETLARRINRAINEALGLEEDFTVEIRRAFSEPLGLAENLVAVPIVQLNVNPDRYSLIELMQDYRLNEIAPEFGFVELSQPYRFEEIG